MDDDDKPPPLRVVSDNPKARADRAARQAKADAERALVRVAASFLRVIAGGNPTAHDLRGEMIKAVLAQEALQGITGRGLTFFEVREALKLPQTDIDATSDARYREWERARGMEDIVQGSLRLAAHQLLNERPHFGGKHSKRLIEDGIEAYTKAFAPPEPAKRVRIQKPTKKQIAADRAARLSFDDVMKKLRPNQVRQKPPARSTEVRQKPPARKKRWSPLDSRSYLDPKPED